MSHPYKNIPDERRWSRAMAGRNNGSIDPVSEPPFRIEAGMRVVTAGSCFAQHVARYLREHGHACFETESAHPLLSKELAQSFNYGIYAARYGNIYTSRQLLQLWHRATGKASYADDAWFDGKAGWFDPLRPTIQPEGFTSREELQADRRQHLEAVKRAFEEMDVLIFTLGLTECWVSRSDGMVYPICPGVAAGEFSPDRHAFINLTVEDVVNDMRAVVQGIRVVNPSMKLILTVSPVPLAATAEPAHVLAASTYSKAVLRVAAEQLCQMPDVYYFPSYEIVNSAGRDYFSDDRRTMDEAGVEHVMSLFVKHLMKEGVMSVRDGLPDRDDFLNSGRAAMDVLCDEQMLDPISTVDGQP